LHSESGYCRSCHERPERFLHCRDCHQSYPVTRGIVYIQPTRERNDHWFTMLVDHERMVGVRGYAAPDGSGRCREGTSDRRLGTTADDV
jgi:hypothetical protein